MARRPVQVTDDLAHFELRSVTEKQVLEHLKQRYSKCKIYTSIGDVLLSINPCSTGFLPFYGPKKIREYRTLGVGRTLPPHVYITVADAHGAMRRTSESQCVVLSGDRGAGKTEAKKQMLEFVVTVATKAEKKLKEKLLKVHSVLEAFGNAKTPSNTNSSRFGEYFQLLFSEDFKLQGGCVSHYLLEKTRVAHQRKDDQNFHIFYYLLAGLSDDQQLEYALDSYSKHRYLASGIPFARDQLLKERASEEWSDLVSAMNTLGFSELEMHAICKILSAVLHLGDVEIERNKETGVATVTSAHLVERVASLLGVTTDELGMSLIFGSTTSRGHRVTVPKTAPQAIEGRDFLAITLYSRLFSWIVWRMNQLILVQNAIRRAPDDSEFAFFDAYGFESFEMNTFTQFCINSFNEQLVYFYNQCVFAWEQDELEAEGVRTPRFIINDNKNSVETIFTPPLGLFSLLDEESRNIQATDSSMLEKFDSQLKKNANYSIGKLTYPAFCINHYAGKVTYGTIGFLKRNRDLVGASIMTCMRGSKDGLVGSLFSVELSDTGTFANQNPIQSPVSPTTQQQRKKNRKQTRSQKYRSQLIQPLGRENEQPLSPVSQHNLFISTQCKNSLSELMDRMLSCNTHFVRCIRPNVYLQPNSFDEQLVMSQLRSLAVLDTVRIRISGFSVRLPFSTFVQRYKILVFPATSNLKENASTCEKVLSKILSDPVWSIGKTKVMLTYSCAQKLDSILDRFIRSAILIQKFFRGWRVRVSFTQLKRSHQMSPGQKELPKRTACSILSSPGLDSSDQGDLSTASITDVFDGSSPGRPNPSSRNSNLSMLSMESKFSMDSVFGHDGQELAPNHWCKILCYERHLQRAEFKKDSRTIVIDGSNITVDESRIGLGALPMDTEDHRVVKVRKHIGKGISLELDEYNNVWVTRRSKSPVFANGSFLSVDVMAKKGGLHLKKARKVFDYELFTNHMNCESQPEILHSKTEAYLMMTCSVFFSFVKDGYEDVDTPCWIEVQVLKAREDALAACKEARETKKTRRCSTGERVTSPDRSPSAETGTRKSREFDAVAKYNNQVRPGKDIDQFRFKRQGWARREVVLNPFMFGTAQALQFVNTQPRSSQPQNNEETSAPNKSAPNVNDNCGSTSPMPASLTHAFDALPSPDKEKSEQTAIEEPLVTTSAVDVEDSGISPRRISEVNVESPRRKEWAKKKFAEKKELEETRSKSRRSTRHSR